MATVTADDSDRATGVLVLAGTPIGSTGDAAPRLLAELAAADVIAAEDTRKFAHLRKSLDVSTQARVVSYYDANEESRLPELVRELQAGKRVVLVTDAGMPSVSDPGYRLVTAAVDAGARVTVVPGPSAVTAALAVSGLPVDRFCFEGFLPRRAGDRTRRLSALADEPRTLVFFEAPHRVAATLDAMSKAFGADRAAAVCRELTKTYEEVRRGTLAELTAWAQGEIRGEITLVVTGAIAERAAPDDDAVRAAVDKYLASGSTRRAAVDAVAAELGLPRRVVYAAANQRST